VLSLVIALTEGSRCFSLPVAQYPRVVPPGVSSPISYPGANAPGGRGYGGGTYRTAGHRHRRHALHVVAVSNDGTYSLTVTFDIAPT